MPEHAADRAAWERRISEALKKVHSRFRDELRAALHRNAPRGEVAGILAKMQKETETQLLAILLLLYIGASDELQADVRATIDAETTRRMAEQWAGERAATFAREHAATTADSVAAAAARARELSPTEANELLEDALDKSLGESRADTAGATETTSGITAGETGAANELRQQGIELTMVWRTERDGKVCPICGKFDGEEVDGLPSPFNNGPPAHPNCRCWQEPEVIDP